MFSWGLSRSYVKKIMAGVVAIAVVAAVVVGCGLGGWAVLPLVAVAVGVGCLAGAAAGAAIEGVDAAIQGKDVVKAMKKGAVEGAAIGAMVGFACGVAAPMVILSPVAEIAIAGAAALPAAVRISSNKERDTQNAIQHQNIGQKKDNNVELLEQNTSVLVDSADLNADMLSHHQRDMNEDSLAEDTLIVPDSADLNSDMLSSHQGDMNEDLLVEDTLIVSDSADLNSDMLSSHQRDMNEDSLAEDTLIVANSADLNSDVLNSYQENIEEKIGHDSNDGSNFGSSGISAASSSEEQYASDKLDEKVDDSVDFSVSTAVGAETESPELRKSRNSRQQLNALFFAAVLDLTSNTNALIRRARRAVDADDLARAAALLTQVLEVFPGHPDAKEIKGILELHNTTAKSHQKENYSIYDQLASLRQSAKSSLFMKKENKDTCLSAEIKNNNTQSAAYFSGG